MNPPTPEILAWHKDSHPSTKDADGSPKVFYHGTGAGPFHAFKPGAYGSVAAGISFTASPEIAGNYAGGFNNMHPTIVNPDTYEETREGANIYPVHLHMRNPIIVDPKEGPRRTARRLLGHDLEDDTGLWVSRKDTEALRNLGYDGMIDHQAGFEPEYVVFDPQQIKSVFNRKPTSDPRLLMSVAAAVDPVAAFRAKYGDTRPNKPLQMSWLSPEGKHYYFGEDNTNKFGLRAFDWTNEAAARDAGVSPQTLQEQGWIRHAGDGQFQMWKPPTPGQVETIEADTHDAHRIGKTPTWEYSAGGEQHSGEDARSLREAFKVHLSEAVADQYGHWLKWPEQNAHINETLRYDPEIWEPNPAFTGDIYTSRPFVLKPSSGYAEGVMAAGAPAYTPIYRPNSTTLDTAMSVFRGVGPREAEAIRGLGRIESDRSGNLDGQENTTSYSLDPEQAESYASSFAYSHEKPTPGRPGYVLEVAKPGPSRVKAIRDKELDVLGATPVSHIKNAWEMRAGAIDADGPSHFVARKLAPEEIAQRFPSSKAALSDRASDLVPKYDDPVGPTVKPTPEVMAWHQGSHPFTKNEDGTPRHFYHGTSAKNFDALKPHDGLIFVTPSTSTADYFANSSERMITPSKHGNVVGDPTGEWTAREGSREYPVMAKALNPFDYENPAHVTALMDRLAHGGAMSSYDLTDGLRRGIEQGTWDQIERTSVVCAIKALKHDGIIVNENGRRNLAVFSPSQIKTLWNPRPTTDPRLMMSESASPFPESRYQEPVYHGSEHMFEAFDPASNVKFDNAPVNLSESTPAWVMTPDEFYAHPHVIRHGEVKGGGAHFALPGKSPFYDPQSDTATVYHLGQPVIADTRQQGVRDRLVAKALTMAPSKEIAERLVKIDRSKPFHFADVEGLGMEDAARALGYHGILKREDADDDNTPTTINLWDTSGVAEAGPNHHMQVRKAVAEGRPVPSHVRAAYGL